MGGGREKLQKLKKHFLDHFLKVHNFRFFSVFLGFSDIFSVFLIFSGFGASSTEKMLYLGAQMELEELPQLKSSSNIPVDHIRTEKTHLEGLQRRPEQKFGFFPPNFHFYIPSS